MIFPLPCHVFSHQIFVLQRHTRLKWQSILFYLYKLSERFDNIELQIHHKGSKGFGTTQQILELFSFLVTKQQSIIFTMKLVKITPSV